MADDETLVQYTDEYEDGTIERVFVRTTTDSAYPSGWRYSLHYGTTEAKQSFATTTPTGTQKATNATSANE